MDRGRSIVDYGNALEGHLATSSVNSYSNVNISSNVNGTGGGDGGRRVETVSAEGRQGFFFASSQEAAMDGELRAGRRGGGEARGGGAGGEGSPTRVRLRRSGDVGFVLLVAVASAAAIGDRRGHDRCYCRCRRSDITAAG